MPESVKVSIEFCNKCKWGLRSFWYLQELFQTFEDKIAELSVKPNNSDPGTFKVVGYIVSDDSVENNIQEVTIWDRKVDGGFPDAKTLKKRIKTLLFHENNDVKIGKHNERGSSALGEHTTEAVQGDGLLVSDTIVTSTSQLSKSPSEQQPLETKECVECAECQLAPK
ncbi:hypothetical protein ACO0QE_003493 [Hanseniaspora vineae]